MVNAFVVEHGNPQSHRLQLNHKLGMLDELHLHQQQLLRIWGRMCGTGRIWRSFLFSFWFGVPIGYLSWWVYATRKREYVGVRGETPWRGGTDRSGVIGVLDIVVVCWRTITGCTVRAEAVFLWLCPSQVCNVQRQRKVKLFSGVWIKRKIRLCVGLRWNFYKCLTSPHRRLTLDIWFYMHIMRGY